MKFKSPLLKGTLVKRYKRFFADVVLESGETVTAHCANSGSMLSVKPEGAPVWISPANNPKRKLQYTWEIVEIEGHKVGINTAHPNLIVSEAIEAGEIPELAGYDSLRREVKYGQNSRIDALLEAEGKPSCYVEVKNVTMKRDLTPSGKAEFPDSVTSRGAKHLVELADMVADGHRAVMFYLVQREDCFAFSVAGDIDPDYEAGLIAAMKAGVEVICYQCHVTPKEISISGPLPMDLPS
ncbi:MAG: DNA/RNA nuclease SfsA [Rhodospirillaceae bacterium]|jgi:sugar fermentation stimulation protein A